MIIEPQFFDHWRVLMTASALDEDKLTPVYIQRLWGHCQLRKSDRFVGMPLEALKAICHYQGDADKIASALIQCGWVQVEEDGTIYIPKFRDANIALFRAWENGAKGGRPKKENENPDQTQSESGLTQSESGLAQSESGLSDKIRLDVIRCDLTGVDKNKSNGNEYIPSSAIKPPDQPVTSNSQADDLSTIQTAWNEMATANTLPTIQRMSEPRKKATMARVREMGLDTVLAMIGRIPTCPHLIGQNDRGWTASFDWAIKLANFDKIIEGNYDRKANDSRNASGNGNGMVRKISADGEEQFYR